MLQNLVCLRLLCFDGDVALQVRPVVKLTYTNLSVTDGACSQVKLCFPLRLRRSSSSGCWEQRDGWDNVSGAAESECLGSDAGSSSVTADGLSEEEGYPLRRRTAPARPTLFTDQPDLTPLIDTNFTSQPPSHLSTPPRDGFDFGGLVERAYMEHEPPSPSTYPAPSSASSSPPSGAQFQRRPSLGDASVFSPQEKASTAGTQATPDWESSVWAMELRGNLIAAGRSSGKLEVCNIKSLTYRMIIFRICYSAEFN